MKHLLIMFAVAFLSSTSYAQKSYTISRDGETGAVVFKGPVTPGDLREEPSFTWFERGEAGYIPDSNITKILRKELPAYTIVVIMGTWCDDSQLLIPRLTKTLKAASFPMQQYVMYGVDRKKQTGGIESQLYNVQRVPTIIVFKGRFEAGRIVESVKKNIETDLMMIISKYGAKD